MRKKKPRTCVAHQRSFNMADSWCLQHNDVLCLILNFVFRLIFHCWFRFGTSVPPMNWKKKKKWARIFLEILCFFSYDSNDLRTWLFFLLYNITADLQIICVHNIVIAQSNIQYVMKMVKLPSSYFVRKYIKLTTHTQQQNAMFYFIAISNWPKCVMCLVCSTQTNNLSKKKMKEQHRKKKNK